ncbi:MAG TPA: hypothetical protein VI636_09810 [Candidatus Angelobacter sp.]
MFEEESEQNETPFNGQPAFLSQYGNASASLQPTSGDNGAFRNLALRLDPGSGVASRMPVAFSSATAPDQNAPAQATPSQAAGAQNSPGQTARGQNPTSLPPIQPRDEQGKTLPKYRMGVGQRILGTVANFANGFARNGASPIFVGPGALNNRYYQDEGLRQQQNRLKSPNTVPAQDSGTPPESDGGGQTSSDPASMTDAYNHPQHTPARRNWRTILSAKAPTETPYAYKAFNHKTGQRVASNDGTTWRLIDNSGGKMA